MSSENWQKSADTYKKKNQRLRNGWNTEMSD